MIICCTDKLFLQMQPTRIKIFCLSVGTWPTGTIGRNGRQRSTSYSGQSSCHGAETCASREDYSRNVSSPVRAEWKISIACMRRRWRIRNIYTRLSIVQKANRRVRLLTIPGFSCWKREQGTLITIVLIYFREEADTIVHSDDAFAPVAYLKFKRCSVVAK